MDEPSLRDRKEWPLVFAALLVTIAAVAVLVIYGVYAGPRGGRVAAALGGVLVAAGCVAIGALVGFLFGIPESLRDESGKGTHLTQVSDWLTKILIGAGVTQLGKIPELLQSTAEYMSSLCLGSDRGAAAFGATILYFSIFGFFAGYVGTRLGLGPALEDANKASSEVLASVKQGPIEQNVSREAASAVVNQTVDPNKLSSVEDLIAYGVARTVDDRQAPGHNALERAVSLAPTDRRAVTGLIYAALYRVKPSGFEQAIEVGERYLAGRVPTRDDATLLAYLACAYGQAYAWEATHDKRAARVAELQQKAVATVTQALQLDDSTRPLLRNVAVPPVGSDDDDLARVTADTPALAALLG